MLSFSWFGETSNERTILLNTIILGLRNILQFFARYKTYVLLPLFLCVLIAGAKLVSVYMHEKSAKDRNLSQDAGSEEFARELGNYIKKYSSGKDNDAVNMFRKLAEKYPDYPDTYLLLAHISAKNPVEMPDVVPILERGIKVIKLREQKDIESLTEIKAFLCVAYVYSNRADDAFKLADSDYRIEKYLPMQTKNFLYYTNDYLRYESEDDASLQQKYKDEMLNNLAKFEENSPNTNARVSFGLMRGVIAGDKSHTEQKLKEYLQTCAPDYRDKLYTYYCLAILAIKSGDMDAAEGYFKKMNDTPVEGKDVLKDWGFLIYSGITEKVFFPETDRNKNLSFESNSGDAVSQKRIGLWDEYFRLIGIKDYQSALSTFEDIMREEMKWTPCQFKDADEAGKTEAESDCEEDMELTGHPVEDLLVLPHKKMVRNILIGSLYEKIGNNVESEKQFQMAARYLGVQKVHFRYPK